MGSYWSVSKVEGEILIMTRDAENIVKQWAAIKDMRKMEADIVAKMQKVSNRKNRGKSTEAKKGKKKAR